MLTPSLWSPQAVPHRAAPLPGELCGEAAGADAPTILLQDGGAHKDPTEHSATEQHATVNAAPTG